MNKADVYGGLAIEGLSCSLAIGGVAVEVAVAAAAPPAGVIASLVITSSVLSATANCAIFVAHSAAVVGGGMDSRQSKQLDMASQVAGSVSVFGSLSGIPPALNTIGYLTNNPRYNDAAAVATAALIVRTSFQPGENGFENISKGVENIKGMIDIANRLNERVEEARTSGADPNSHSTTSQGTVAHTAATANDTKNDPPPVASPSANEDPKHNQTEPLEKKDEMQCPVITPPSGNENNFDNTTAVEIHRG
ncbi:hypothetical protein OKW34_008794 [Paraburkholderia youngii]|uniref:hypothetical protein n=1 Tax=Paraburkholderia youngii TaxID=2782701 RepID=UPI003D1D45E0